MAARNWRECYGPFRWKKPPEITCAMLFGVSTKRSNQLPRFLDADDVAIRFKESSDYWLYTAEVEKLIENASADRLVGLLGEGTLNPHRLVNGGGVPFSTENDLRRFTVQGM